jgi:hypothetical protein
LKKELVQVKAKIKKLKERKALIDEELEPLFIREEELENDEIVAICRKNNITIEELLANAQKRKSSVGKEQGQDNKNKAKEKENFNENKEN